jgi:RNA polymerase sigma-70 factor (ECF subfamily)
LPTEQENIFIQWLDDYKGLIYKIARAFTHSSDELEDLFQDILLQLWISVPNFKQESKESTWIYRVSFNTAVVWDRKRKKHKKLKSVNLSDSMIGESPPDAKTEQIEELYDAIRQLPKLDASLILMSLDKLSYKEMSEITGMSESNVGVKLNRAKKQLAEKLKGLADEL